VVFDEALITVLGLSDVRHGLSGFVLGLAKEKVDADALHFVPALGGPQFRARDLGGLNGAACNLSNAYASGIPIREEDLDGFRTAGVHGGRMWEGQ
jgi:hypothetical protein